jgi:hypothetical protein
MTKEITVKGSIICANGGSQFSTGKSFDTLEVNQAAKGGFVQTVSVGTAAADLVVGSGVTNLGWARFSNLDATNWMKWGPKDGGVMIPVGKIMPGQFADLQLYPGITIQFAANAAPLLAQVLILEA